MKSIGVIISLLLFALNLNAQINDTLNQIVSPVGGINQLAVKYYGIDFSKEQRKILKEKEIEFIFNVDKDGKPSLSDINGISNTDILDSLRYTTSKLENFNPSIVNGVPTSSIYFMQLVFPTYKMTNYRYGLLQGKAYNEAKLEDFEYLQKSNERMDMVFGGLANQFIGKPSNHLGFGGGMKMDITYTNKSKLVYGLFMSAYGNKLKKDYPISSSREQFSSPPTLLVGFVFGKWFDYFNIQTEIGSATMNLTEKIDVSDSDWVQLSGWSPGIVVNYPIQLGKDIPMYYYGSPNIYQHQLNLHFGLRYLKYSLKEASGFMAEIGIGYRMVITGVKEYKLKDEFLNK